MEKSHTNLAKIIHWGFIILYAYGILKQIDDLSQLEDTALLIFEVMSKVQSGSIKDVSSA